MTGPKPYNNRFGLAKRTRRRKVGSRVPDNEQLAHKVRGKCRLGIYKPAGWRSTRMKLAIKNLHPRGTWRCPSLGKRLAVGESELSLEHMKNSLLVAAILLALSGALAISQDLPSTLPSRNRQYYMGVPPQLQGRAWLFHIAGKHYRAMITHDEVEAGPDWKTAMPLPLSFSKAEEIARAELKKLVGDSASWEVTDLQLKRIPSGDQPIWSEPSLTGTGLEFQHSLNGYLPKWFYVIGMEPTEGSSRQKHDSFFAVMNLSGVVGKIEEVTAAR